ncbi:MAG: hypothetical protein CMH56_11500 [Myxococcales bacterium]|nr:hypothetical protein [Myxococcales bacterium]
MLGKTRGLKAFVPGPGGLKWGPRAPWGMGPAHKPPKQNRFGIGQKRLSGLLLAKKSIKDQHFWAPSHRSAFF